MPDTVNIVSLPVLMIVAAVVAAGAVTVRVVNRLGWKIRPKHVRVSYEEFETAPKSEDAGQNQESGADKEVETELQMRDKL